MLSFNQNTEKVQETATNNTPIQRVITKNTPIQRVITNNTPIQKVITNMHKQKVSNKQKNKPIWRVKIISNKSIIKCNFVIVFSICL